MKQCPKCGCDHDKPGTFCSRKCSNSREWSDSDKAKKSSALKGRPSDRRGLPGVAWSDDRKQKLSETAREKSRLRFLAGEIAERSTLRWLIAERDGYCCQTCQIGDWNNKPITLIVDHIDGDASNNNPDNLRLLCPNCNSQTDTFSGRNKGNGRKARGLPTR